MPAAKDVKPKKWKKITVLFDNEQYSVISGIYDFEDPQGNKQFVLGERWNGSSKHPLGFPNVAGYPIWHVVPSFLALPILDGLLKESRGSNKKHCRYLQKVQEEINRQRGYSSK
jgi:hypothetical protein